MSIESEITRLVNEVATQQELLDQVITTLENKVVGGDVGGSKTQTVRVKITGGNYEVDEMCEVGSLVRYEAIGYTFNKGTTNTPYFCSSAESIGDSDWYSAPSAAHPWDDFDGTTSKNVTRMSRHIAIIVPKWDVYITVRDDS